MESNYNEKLLTIKEEQSPEIHAKNNNGLKIAKRKSKSKSIFSKSLLSFESVLVEPITNNLITLFSSIFFNLTHLINLIILNNIDNSLELLPISAYQIAYIYLFIFGFRFLKGPIDNLNKISNEAFNNKDYSRVSNFYHESKIYCILFFLIIIFPFCFISNYILPFFNLQEELLNNSSNLIKILMLAYIIEVFSKLNMVLISIQHFNIVLFIINVVFFFLHIIISLLLIFICNLGLYGIAFSMVIIAFLRLILTHIILVFYNNHNILLDNETFYFIDIKTELLEKTSFYYFSKSAFIKGLIAYFIYSPIDLIMALCFFISQETFLASVIVLNIISFLFMIINDITHYYQILIIKLNFKVINDLLNKENSSELIEFIKFSNIDNLFTFSKNKDIHIEENVEIDKENKEVVTCNDIDNNIDDEKNEDDSSSLIVDEDEKLSKIKEFLSKIIKNSKYFPFKNKIEDQYIDFNLEKVIILGKSLFIFSFLLALLFSIFFFLFGDINGDLFSYNSDVKLLIVCLLKYYSIMIFFDWGNHIFISIIDVYYSLKYYFLIKGLLCMFLFLPLGLLLSNLKFGVYGYWISLYLYFILFFFISLKLILNFDFKGNIKKNRKRNELKSKLFEETEYYYN